MSTNVLEKLGNQITERKAKALDAFRGLVIDVADGKQKKAQEAEAILDAAGMGVPDLSEAVAKLEKIRALRALIASVPELTEESKRLARVVGDERSKVKEMNDAHELAMKEQQKVVRVAEHAYQEAAKKRQAALDAESQLSRMAGEVFPEVAADIQMARQNLHSARQRKAAAEERLSVRTGAIAEHHRRVRGFANDPTAQDDLRRLEAPLQDMRDEVETLTAEIAEAEQALADGNAKLLVC